MDKIGNLLTDNVLFKSRIINIEKVISTYIINVSRVRLGENCKISIIQPICVIDEYAKIFRVCVWFSPPQPPTRIDSMPIRVSVREWVE